MSPWVSCLFYFHYPLSLRRIFHLKGYVFVHQTNTLFHLIKPRICFSSHFTTSWIVLNLSSRSSFPSEPPKIFYFALWNRQGHINKPHDRSVWQSSPWTSLPFTKGEASVRTRPPPTPSAVWPIRPDFCLPPRLTDGKVRSVTCNETQCKCGCRVVAEFSVSHCLVPVTPLN